jgi:hypothetical protein
MDNQLPQTVSELIERFERNQLPFVQCQGLMPYFLNSRMLELIYKNYEKAIR